MRCCPQITGNSADYIYVSEASDNVIANNHAVGAKDGNDGGIFADYITGNVVTNNEAVRATRLAVCCAPAGCRCCWSVNPRGATRKHAAAVQRF